jgi:hypothetical protein
MSARPASVVVLAGICLVASLAAWGREQLTAVTENEAHRLVLSTLTAAARRLPGMRFDRGNPASLNGAQHPERFYLFEVTAETPGDASPVLGHFAVNKDTGDVWDAVACTKYASPEITQFQHQRRTHAGLSEKTFRRMSAQAPCEP